MNMGFDKLRHAFRWKPSISGSKCLHATHSTFTLQDVDAAVSDSMVQNSEWGLQATLLALDIANP